MTPVETRESSENFDINAWKAELSDFFAHHQERVAMFRKSICGRVARALGLSDLTEMSAAEREKLEGMVKHLAEAIIHGEGPDLLSESDFEKLSHLDSHSFGLHLLLAMTDVLSKNQPTSDENTQLRVGQKVMAVLPSPIETRMPIQVHATLQEFMRILNEEEAHMRAFFTAYALNLMTFWQIKLQMVKALDRPDAYGNLEVDQKILFHEIPMALIVRIRELNSTSHPNYRPKKSI